MNNPPIIDPIHSSNKRNQLINLLLWLGILLAIALLQLAGNTVEYLFFLRAPAIGALFLLTFPLVAIYLVPNILRNLFVLKDWGQLAISIAAAVISGIGIVQGANAILLNAPARFGVYSLAEKFPYLFPLSYGFAIFLALPTAYFAIRFSRGKLGLSDRRIGIGAGLGAALGVTFGIFFAVIRNYLDSEAFPQFPVIWLLKLLILDPSDRVGYLTEGGTTLAAGHLPALAFLLTMAIVYAVAKFWFAPERKTKDSFESPALLYVLLIATSLILILGSSSFLLDRFRIPLLPPLLIISAIIYTRFNVDHYYQLRGTLDRDSLAMGASPQTGSSKEDTALREQQIHQAIEARLQLAHETVPNGDLAPKDGRTLVVVCASGGGIQASGWAVTVLTGLRKALGNSFSRHIGLISSVSGGSVGSMYYIDAENAEGEQGFFTTADDIFKRATRDSLDATGWGLAFLDFWRFFGFPTFFNPIYDRGWSIEQDWKLELSDRNLTLGNWKSAVQKGRIPIPVFNATLVEDGRRFQITPMGFGANPKSKSVDFNTLFKGADLDVTTAARLSATFPYVTPVARNDKGRISYHVADGGYFDNNGVTTGSEFLRKFVLNNQNNQLNIKRVLFLTIVTFPQPSETSPQPKKTVRQGWLMSIAGPFIAALNVRSSTQSVQNAISIEGLQLRSRLRNLRDKMSDREKARENIQKLAAAYDRSDDDVKNTLEELESEADRQGIEFKAFDINFPIINDEWFLPNQNDEANEEPWIREVGEWLQEQADTSKIPLDSDLVNRIKSAFFSTTGEYQAPLSWKLTSEQKFAIKLAWEIYLRKPDTSFKAIQETWQKWHPATKDHL